MSAMLSEIRRSLLNYPGPPESEKIMKNRADLRWDFSTWASGNWTLTYGNMAKLNDVPIKDGNGDVP